MKRLRFLLFLCLVLFLLAGCQTNEKKEISSCIEEEMNLLKCDDREAITALFSGSELLDDLGKEELPAEILDTFQLFYQNFSHSIKDIEIEEDSLHASALLLLKTLDAQSLAKDFAAQSIVKQLQNQAAPSLVEYSLEDYYFSLQQLLTDHDYEILESEYSVSLSKENGFWNMDPDPDLPNALTGGFITYAADPDLFQPEEIIALHFDTIKSFDTEQMNRFLSLDNLFSTDDEYKRTIAKALAGQILNHLDYEIIDVQSDGINASVTARVTTCDWNSIIRQYRDRVAEYTSTAQALADGISVRLTKANQILLDCINTNTSSADSEITLNLVNDGTNWKLQMNDAFAEAILGDVDEAIANISTSPDGE